MEIFIFNEAIPRSFSNFVLFIQISNTSVTGYSRAFRYAICSVLDHMASSIEKPTKPTLLRVENFGEKANPSHLIQIHITACFPVMVWFLHSTFSEVDIF